MKVVCDNCRAVYKVPDAKLVKAVNKATCRNCGHRMLIPRPKPGADPDERTLVTAVPPTPVGAPPRTGREVDSQALPARGSRSRSAARSLPPSALDWEDGPDTAVVDSPTVQDPSRRTPAPAARSVPRHTPPPAPSPAAISPVASAAPMSAPGAPPRRTPAPVPGRAATGTRAAYKAAAIHDPSGDMNWALAGTILALLGAFVLAFLSVFNYIILMWLGLAMTFGGGVITFLILLTGSRGRRPARALLSVALGFVVAVMMASTMTGVKWGTEKVLSQINFSNAGMQAALSVPTPPEPTPPGSAGVATLEDDGLVPLDPANAAGAAGEAAPAAAAPARPAPARPAPARPAPSRPAPARPAPARPAPARPAPAPPRAADPIIPPPAPAPPPAAPAPAPEPAGASGVPVEAVHVILSNNLAVKRCFVPLFRNGTLPPRVEVKFNILPAGNASGIRIVSPSQHSGGDLETCLASVISGIRFPPTNGNGTSITYPFILQ